MTGRDLFRGRLASLVRFAAVGVANTGVYYLFYRLFLPAMPYLAAHLLAWVISMVFSFFVNSWFTFRTRPTWSKFLAFPLTTVANVAFTTAGSALLVEGIGVDERYATVIMGILAIPVTFTLTRLVLTRPDARKDSHDHDGHTPAGTARI